jgi:signal transduction histidine kinase
MDGIVAKQSLKVILPEATLRNLIPPFEDAFNLKGKVGVFTKDEEWHYGANVPGQSPALRETLEVDRKSIGLVVLFVENSDNATFTKALHYLAVTLSQVATETWRRHMMSDEVLERYDELNLIYEIGNRFVEGKAQNEIIKGVLDDTNRIIRADAGVIYIWNQAESTIHPVDYFGNKSSTDFWGGRMRELALSTLYAYEEAQLFDADKVVCAPLRYNDEMLGALVLFYERENMSFKASDVNLLTTLTHNTALFIYAARLLEQLAHEKRQLEETLTELQATKDKLSQAERLSIIGQTVSTLVHDMRKPLNNVMGYASLLQETDLTQEERYEFAAQIIKYVTLFSSMMQEILDYVAGNEKVQKTVVGVEEYMSDVRDILMPPGLELPVKITVNSEAAQGYRMNIDRQRFSRVFQNLVNNAIDAIEATSGTQIDIDVHPVEEMLQFMITDDGPGVPPEIAETLFQPFVTYGKSHGTGLGLAIVDRMVSIHGGKIRYEQAPGGGARFVFTVPQFKNGT